LTGRRILRLITISTPAGSRVPNPIFIDTAYVIALINERDQYHSQAVELANRFAGQPLITTDAVLLEIGNALARSFKQEAIVIIEQFLTADEVKIVHLTPELFTKSFALYRQYQDKTWSLVDCISIVVMGEADISQVLSFDRHFIQAGFTVLDSESTG
jgi:predicted nucleic acid-binding protein